MKGWSRRIENICSDAYPVAWAEGGNYVFIYEARGGAVFFWDHEEPEKITELAPSLGAFLDILEPRRQKGHVEARAGKEGAG